MDLEPRSPNAPGRPSLLAYDRDHLSALFAHLAELDAIAGQPLPRTQLPGGLLSLEVPREALLPVARALRDSLGYEMLTSVTGVDMVDHLESLYHFRSLAQTALLQVRVRVPSEQPEVDSLVSLYPSANWLERETYDLFGIVYRGHPDLRRILLDDEFEGYPLRKSFRPTPTTVHDRATTQVPADRAIAGEHVRNQERVPQKRLGQGNQERVHPGKTTFGSAAVFIETGQGVEPGEEGVSPSSTVQRTGPTMRPQQG